MDNRYYFIEEMLLKFSRSPKTYPLRGGYKYQNIMYVIAGEVIRNVSGKSWQDFMKINILDKIGLECTKTWSKDIFNYGIILIPIKSIMMRDSKCSFYYF